MVTVVSILSALWWIRIRGLWKLPGGWNWLWGNLGLTLKSLIQFSADGWGCVPPPVAWVEAKLWWGNADLQNKGSKAKRVLPRECTGHSKHPLPTTQEMTLNMDISKWSIPKSDGLYSLQPKMEKFSTVSKKKTRSWLWFRSWAPYCKIHTSIEESRENH